MYYYSVWIVDSSYKKVKHMDIVRAISESDAVEQICKRFGAASKYSGAHMARYLGERC